MASNWFQLLSGKKLRKVEELGREVIRKGQAKGSKLDYYTPSGLQKKFFDPDVGDHGK